jgi:alkanesulfonate monooxygenase SsuD/methylene tetrahydromethanopterin reductase-like flavin-dependent oxidoreductase (luciferase family)
MFAPFDPKYHAKGGEYIGMYVHAKPLQQPRPPVWLMSNTPFTYEMAGARGMHVIGMSSAKDSLRALLECLSERFVGRSTEEFAGR